MNILEYPFDPQFLLIHRKQIRAELLQTSKELIEKRIAILGGSTTSHIKDMLELFLLHQGICPIFYESAYGQFYQEAVFQKSELTEFAPEVIYIHTTNRNINRFPSICDDVETVRRMLDEELKRFQTIWECLSDRFHCPLIQNNFEMPLYRFLGNKDASDIHGATNFLSKLNMSFYDYAETHANFYICDINYISADYGLKKWFDSFYWYMYRYAMNIDAIPFLAHNIANIIKSLFGKNKKGMVLDLDNTLWGGMIGEDGLEDIQLGPETPEGEMYLDFQKYIKAHKQLGILLNIASKNEEDTALKGLTHSAGVLHSSDFINIKANWHPKDGNILAIAQNLNLLPESFVFVDDNPAERDLVKKQLPGIAVPNIGEAQYYIQNIDRNGYFEVTSITRDDMERNRMYQDNVKREEYLTRFNDYGEYLQSLLMKAQIAPFTEGALPRITQLVNKTNQFNLTAKRYTKEQLEEIYRSSKWITLYGCLEDKFGKYGLIAVVIAKVCDDICEIELWCMSCRVLKRDMEFAMMDSLIQECKKRKVHIIKGVYRPTGKNRMVSNFYPMQGFSKLSEDEMGNTVWSYDLNKCSESMRNKYIRIVEEKDE